MKPGSCYIRGRKKEMIVTPEGLNVFPEDVERVLNEIPGVRDSAVVGAPFGESNAERVQAVLLLDDPSMADDVVRQANVRPARSPEDSCGRRVARGRASTHRGHPQAQTSRASRSG